jgi:NitT/TauT family transport system permease protein
MTFISLLLRALLGLAALALVGEYYADAVQIPVFFPAPSAVARKVLDLAASTEFHGHVIASAAAIAEGLAAAAVIGIVGGLALGANAVLRWLVGPLVLALAGVPALMLAPLLIIWFGSDPMTKVLIVALVATFPIMRTVMIEATAFGARASVFTDATGTTVAVRQRPSVVRAIVAGLRWGLLLGVVGLFFGEFVGSKAGIGSFISQAFQLLDTVAIMAAFLTLAIPMMVVMLLFEAIEAQLGA